MARNEAQIEAARYTTRTTEIDNGKGYWSHLRVEVLRDGEVVGEYRRRYSSLFQTFHPFVGVDGQVYALYSRDYTATRVMRLPSCEDVGGEEPSGNGFCPTGYYVPTDEDNPYIQGRFGFVSGCVWGDDTSWKIQHLDLSKIAEGILARDERYGYVEMPGNVKTLKECVDCDLWDEDRPIVRIAAADDYHTDGGETWKDRAHRKEMEDAARAEAEACALLVEGMANEVPQPTPQEIAAALRARHPAKVPTT